MQTVRNDTEVVLQNDDTSNSSMKMERTSVLLGQTEKVLQSIISKALQF